ncbi:MAG: hypothetical protein U0Q03_16585 [Acidimicrobiales bacterium]
MSRIFPSLRRRALGALATAAIAAVGATAVATPALAQDGPPPLRVGDFSYQQLLLYCAQSGGTFEGGDLGSAYFCVLPSGAVIFCDYQTSACVVLRVAKPPKSTRPPVSMSTTGVVLSRTA